MFQLATSQPLFPLLLSHVLKGTATLPQLFLARKEKYRIASLCLVKSMHTMKQTSRTQTGEPPIVEGTRSNMDCVQEKKSSVQDCMQVRVAAGDWSKQTQARQLVNRWRRYLIILHALHLFLSDKGRKGILQITKCLHTPGKLFSPPCKQAAVKPDDEQTEESCKVTCQ